jgi:phospholipid N-methyltransferase
MGGCLQFLWACLVNHKQTGSVVPSQRALVAKMIRPVPENFSGQIIELGPGNGTLTVRLAAKCPNARILACEINPGLARRTRSNLEAAGLDHRVEVISDSAQNLLNERIRRGVSPADFIISGIPLANLPRPETFDLIETIHSALRRRGMYIQFQYSLMDRKKIKDKFWRVRTVPALLNFPPALVYYAWK